MILLRVYFEWIKVREELSGGLESLIKRSNNQIQRGGYDPELFLWLALRAEWWEHFTRYRQDRLFGGAVRIKRFAARTP